MVSRLSSSINRDAHGPEPSDINRINFSWLLRLRWAAVGGKALTVFLVTGPMGIDLPIGPVTAIIAIEALTNLACGVGQHRRKTVSQGLIGSLMIVDVGLFTALLYFSGGPFNPFSFLYLVYIALAAIVLSSGWTWTLVLVALGGNAALFFHHVPLPMGGGEASHVHHHGMSMHLRGMWVAFGVAAAFIVYFLRRIKAALDEREAELAHILDQQARGDRLASVATLAAGAAHELSTPLSTIAVIAKELERSADGETVEDARLIREQVDRCRNILTQMAGDAGESPGEAAAPVEIERLMEATLEGLVARERVSVTLGVGAAGQKLTIPLRAVAQALRGVIKNGLDASGEAAVVAVSVERQDSEWHFEVRDTGSGMSSEVRSRAAEPFFTTKEPGQGMGLGLFLTRTVFEFLGGTFTLESELGQGTVATLTLPATNGRTGEAANSQAA